MIFACRKLRREANDSVTLSPRAKRVSFEESACEVHYSGGGLVARGRGVVRVPYCCLRVFAVYARRVSSRMCGRESRDAVVLRVIELRGCEYSQECVGFV